VAAAAAAVVGKTAELADAGTGIPGPAQLVDGAVRLVAASPSTAFSVAELLTTMAQREEGKDRLVCCHMECWELFLNGRMCTTWLSPVVLHALVLPATRSRLDVIYLVIDNVFPCLRVQGRVGGAPHVWLPATCSTSSRRGL
jgi:hypothetical protein